MKHCATGRIVVAGNCSITGLDPSMTLKALGFDLDVVGRGESVVERVREGASELVVLGDALDPGAAEDVCHQIRLDAKTRHIPVLRLTGPAELEFAVDRGSVNADDVLVAPFGKAELLLRVRNLMRQRAFQEQLSHKIEELEDTKTWLVELAHMDALTSLYNRRYLEEFTSREVQRSRRYGRVLAVVMADVDRFKAINDSYGHQTGDRLLRDLGLLLRDSVRNVDLACRYGGEEFALILPETDQPGATLVAERVRERVGEHNFAAGCPNVGRPVTVSLGVATFPADASDMEHLFAAADRRLYRAKADGRNRVIATDPATSTIA